MTTSCLSTMRTYQGHEVFNPVYLFYLESSARDEWQKPDDVLDALALPKGAVVADVGAGGGYFTEKLVHCVGDSGRVYATDLQKTMLRKLRRRVQKNGWTNVLVIHSAFDDPCLPVESCDLVFFSSVYKEIDNRVSYMRKVRRALKATGRVAILEYRPDAEGPGPPRRLRLDASEVIRELEAAGFQLLERFTFLPREYFLVFGKQ